MILFSKFPRIATIRSSITINDATAIGFGSHPVCRWRPSMLRSLPGKTWWACVSRCLQQEDKTGGTGDNKDKTADSPLFQDGGTETTGEGKAKNKAATGPVPPPRRAGPTRRRPARARAGPPPLPSSRRSCKGKEKAAAAPSSQDDATGKDKEAASPLPDGGRERQGQGQGH